MAAPGHRYTFGPFVLDPAEHVLLRDGTPVPLTPKAFETLVVLVERAGHLVPKDELLARVWRGVVVEEATLAQNIATIRKAFGRGPDARGAIETVPKVGYRFAWPVHVLDAPAGLPLVHPAARSTRRVARLRAAASVAGGILALGSIGGLLWLTGTRNVAPTAGMRTLAILPFRNIQPDPAWDFLGFSLADAIAGRLSGNPRIILRPSSYMERYRDGLVDPQVAARELAADTLLTGSFLKQGATLRIAAELVDVPQSRILWRETLDVPYDRLMTVQDLVARRVLEGMRVQLGPETGRPPQRLEAYELRLKGADLVARHQWARAIPLLERSVALDPLDAEAWAQLGVAYYGHAAFQRGGDPARALEAYERALEIDPTLLHPRVWLAMYYTETGQLELAVPLLREVIAANPSHGQAYWWLGYAYRYAGLLEASLEASERAQMLDPAGGGLGVTTNTYLYLGDYTTFAATLRDDGSARTAFYEGLGALYLRDPSRAIAAFERAYRLDPALVHARIGKAMRHALAGEAAAGRRELARIEEQDRPVDGELIYKVAQAYALLGDRDDALRLLARAIEQDFFCYPYIARDELMQSLRGDPAFARLVAAARQRHVEFRRTILAEPAGPAS